MFVDLFALVNGQTTEVTINAANVAYCQETALPNGEPATCIYIGDSNAGMTLTLALKVVTEMVSGAHRAMMGAHPRLVRLFHVR